MRATLGVTAQSSLFSRACTDSMPRGENHGGGVNNGLGLNIYYLKDLSVRLRGMDQQYYMVANLFSLA